MVDDLEKKYNVYMHFDFDDYDAEIMVDLRKQSKDMKGKFRVSRMVPQGYFHFFFSYHRLLECLALL